MCPYGSGIRGIARVHLPESYSLLPSITGQPCIAHICARAFRISSFSFPRAVRQLCFFPLPSERKKEISFLREISSSKIHLLGKSIGKGGRVISSLPFQQTATNHRKARYKRSALVLLGYLSKHAANISSSITFLLPPPWNVILLYTQLIALGEKRDKSFVQEGEDIIEIGKLTIQKTRRRDPADSGPNNLVRAKPGKLIIILSVVNTLRDATLLANYVVSTTGKIDKVLERVSLSLSLSRKL